MDQWAIFLLMPSLRNLVLQEEATEHKMQKKSDDQSNEQSHIPEELKTNTKDYTKVADQNSEEDGIENDLIRSLVIQEEEKDNNHKLQKQIDGNTNEQGQKHESNNQTHTIVANSSSDDDDDNIADDIIRKLVFQEEVDDDTIKSLVFKEEAKERSHTLDKQTENNTNDQDHTLKEPESYNHTDTKEETKEQSYKLDKQTDDKIGEQYHMLQKNEVNNHCNNEESDSLGFTRDLEEKESIVRDSDDAWALKHQNIVDGIESRKDIQTHDSLGYVFLRDGGNEANEAQELKRQERVDDNLIENFLMTGDENDPNVKERGAKNVIDWQTNKLERQSEVDSDNEINYDATKERKEIKRQKCIISDIEGNIDDLIKTSDPEDEIDQKEEIFNNLHLEIENFSGDESFKNDPTKDLIRKLVLQEEEESKNSKTDVKPVTKDAAIDHNNPNEDNRKYFLPDNVKNPDQTGLDGQPFSTRKDFTPPISLDSLDIKAAKITSNTVMSDKAVLNMQSVEKDASEFEFTDIFNISDVDRNESVTNKSFSEAENGISFRAKMSYEIKIEKQLSEIDTKSNDCYDPNSDDSKDDIFQMKKFTSKNYKELATNDHNGKSINADKSSNKEILFSHRENMQEEFRNLSQLIPQPSNLTCDNNDVKDYLIKDYLRLESSEESLYPSDEDEGSIIMSSKLNDVEEYSYLANDDSSCQENTPLVLSDLNKSIGLEIQDEGQQSYNNHTEAGVRKFVAISKDLVLTEESGLSFSFNNEMELEKNVQTKSMKKKNHTGSDDEFDYVFLDESVPFESLEGKEVSKLTYIFDHEIKEVKEIKEGLSVLSLTLHSWNDER